VSDRPTLVRPPLWPAYLATYTFMVGGWSASIAVPLHVVALGGSLAEAGLIAAVRFGLQAFLQLRSVPSPTRGAPDGSCLSRRSGTR
jgi:hypothetical protein